LIRVIYLSIKFSFANQNQPREQISKGAFTWERKSSTTFDWLGSYQILLFYSNMNAPLWWRRQFRFSELGLIFRTDAGGSAIRNEFTLYFW